MGKKINETPPDPKQLALAAIPGLEIGDVLKFFYDRASERDKKIADMADVGDDGEFEIDGAIVSEGDDNGAYVLGWSWASFAGTALTKICECCEADTEQATEVKTTLGESEFYCAECAKEMTDA
ncbi:hypothetical protein [Bradyrhizobium elkanii]|uniref:hypothetical protein n=1 Tax=Bradyrhizobium elkanii TaxID=29448 RepID=UPI001449040D|nr:hypothetical protein [Bradyrhizobium elkanii]MCP1932204.1 hypothetical protein [Bradyrhizobium elkanii]MCS3577256.1 hypothetical protein [Bradyrhizobium elkanii]MCS3720133.1 hypothetical protein [Bradyrhizobium elkanii]MCS4004550.1 hypothetical protein [Bradyrhizobium elkanii USDA 61]WLA44015.1 hypothetical protein QNJ95_22330 [Bradyrhizobium elkanii]